MGVAVARRERLLRLLHRDGHVDAEQAAVTLGVASVTIRRDLRLLADQGLVTRVHGGAVTLDDGPADRRTLALRIGMLTPNSNYYYNEVLAGAEAAAARAGCRLVYATHGDFAVREGERLRRLLELDLDAVIMTTGYEQEDLAETMARVDGCEIPVVLCERWWEPPHLRQPRDRIGSDHRTGAVLGMQHLYGLGHRRVLLTSPPTATSPMVRSGALLATEHQPGASLVDDGDRLGYASDNSPIHAEILERIRSDRVTAVLVHADKHAAQFARYAVAHGVRVPEDVSILSYDDVTAATEPIPLTAVAPQKRLIGSRAVELAIERVRDPLAPYQAVSLVPSVVVRASTGPPP